MGLIDITPNLQQQYSIDCHHTFISRLVYSQVNYLTECTGWTSKDVNFIYDQPQPDVQDHLQCNRELIVVQPTKHMVLSKVIAYYINAGYILTSLALIRHY